MYCDLIEFSVFHLICMRIYNKIIRISADLLRKIVVQICFDEQIFTALITTIRVGIFILVLKAFILVAAISKSIM